MRNYNTKHIQHGSCIRDFPDISYFLLILRGMDCWWEFLYTGTTVGVFKYNNDWCDDQLQLSVLAYSERRRESAMKTILKCHRVGRCRVRLVALAACSPAESVCPPCPEHAPPPLSEPFPWQ